LGTDYPFPLGEESPGSLIESLTNITEHTKQRLLKGTALEWLNKTEQDYEMKDL
jgi:aminocarboxymuconate-semialdehyde decarboxylase